MHALALILLLGWGGAACIAAFTDRVGLATFVFVATIITFIVWPLRRDRK